MNCYAPPRNFPKLLAMVSRTSKKENRKAQKSNNSAQPQGNAKKPASELVQKAKVQEKERESFMQQQLASVNKFLESLDGLTDKFQNYVDEALKIDRENAKELRMLEKTAFDKKKSHFDRREEVISNDHPEFWKNLFQTHPEIDIFLSSAASDEVEDANDKIKASIKSLKVMCENTGDNYVTSATISFNPNDYFENESLTRTVHFESPEKVTKVECTELKAKPALLTVLENAKKSDNPLEKPHVVNFVNKENDELMNEFVDCLKNLYNDPVGHLQNALEMEAENMSDMEDSDDLSDIEEAAETDSSEN